MDFSLKTAKATNILHMTHMVQTHFLSIQLYYLDRTYH